MNNTWDTILIFGILTGFHFWGGGGIGAGIAGRRGLPVLWGVLIGAAPLYFGIERATMLGSWGALAWQIAMLLLGALSVAAWLPGLRAFFLRPGMSALMIGTFIMAAGATLGAWLVRSGFEFGSVLAGGVSFLFGASWFGAGIRQLRAKRPT